VVLLERDTKCNHCYIWSRLEISVEPVPLCNAAHDVAVLLYIRSFILVLHPKTRPNARRSAPLFAASRGGSRHNAAFGQVAPTEASPSIFAFVCPPPGPVENSCESGAECFLATCEQSGGVERSHGIVESGFLTISEP
jgi:hypothetical protein